MKIFLNSFKKPHVITREAYFNGTFLIILSQALLVHSHQYHVNAGIPP